MDCPRSCPQRVVPVVFHDAARNEGCPRSTARDLREQGGQARCRARSLLSDELPPAYASADASGPLRYPGRRRSTSNASRRALSTHPRSNPTSQRRAIASRRATAPEDVPARQKRSYIGGTPYRTALARPSAEVPHWLATPPYLP